MNGAVGNSARMNNINVGIQNRVQKSDDTASGPQHVTSKTIPRGMVSAINHVQCTLSARVINARINA